MYVFFWQNLYVCLKFNLDADLTEFSTAALQQKRMKSQLTDAIKDSCLPKMLCEMASKPEYMLTEKEKDLMHLIRYYLFYIFQKHKQMFLNDFEKCF